jgi:hypothetical protein
VPKVHAFLKYNQLQKGRSVRCKIKVAGKNFLKHLQTFLKQWFNSALPPSDINNTFTMENYYKNCTYGKVVMSNVSRARAEGP